jgi:hypothetical protein
MRKKRPQQIHYEKMKEKIRDISDGVRKSAEIASLLGVTPKYVQGVWRKNPDIPRPRQAPPSRECNPSWKGGRRLGKDGYVYISVEKNRPSAQSTQKSYGIMPEHRKIMEDYLGRYLRPEEVVHHKNGCTLDNRIQNLELCASNGEHLSMELEGKKPDWSKEGVKRLGRKRTGSKVDKYHFQRKYGEIRVRQILLARKILGEDHPLLFGMGRYLEQCKDDLQKLSEQKSFERSL